jgi:hypothetical protein
VEPQWSHVWNIIAAMDNLIELKVFLQDPGFPEWDGMQCICCVEKDMLAPLWKVKRRLRVFEMNVPWVDLGKHYHAITEEAPFSLRRIGIDPLPRY